MFRFHCSVIDRTRWTYNSGTNFVILSSKGKVTMKKIIDSIFWIVANSLDWLSKKLGITYNEINIITYYILIPLVWVIMLDFIIKLPIFTILFLLTWGIIFFRIDSFKNFCDKLFRLSQDFILFFGNYYSWSVIICVLVPIMITVILVFML